MLKRSVCTIIVAFVGFTTNLHGDRDPAPDESSLDTVSVGKGILLGSIRKVGVIRTPNALFVYAEENLSIYSVQGLKMAQLSAEHTAIAKARDFLVKETGKPEKEIDRALSNGKTVYQNVRHETAVVVWTCPWMSK